MITLMNIIGALHDVRHQEALAHHEPRQWRIRINPGPLRLAMVDAGLLGRDDVLAHDAHLTLMGATVDIDDRLPLHQFQISAPFNDAGLDYRPVTNEGSA